MNLHRMTPCFSLLVAALASGCTQDSLSRVKSAGTNPPTTPTDGQAPKGLAVGEQCFWGPDPSGSVVPLSRIIHTFRADEHGGVVDATIVFNREFVDNTYGTNAIGWN